MKKIPFVFLFLSVICAMAQKAEAANNGFLALENRVVLRGGPWGQDSVIYPYIGLIRFGGEHSWTPKTEHAFLIEACWNYKIYFSKSSCIKTLENGMPTAHGALNLVQFGNGWDKSARWNTSAWLLGNSFSGGGQIVYRGWDRFRVSLGLQVGFAEFFEYFQAEFISASGTDKSSKSHGYFSLTAEIPLIVGVRVWKWLWVEGGIGYGAEWVGYRTDEYKKKSVNLYETSALIRLVSRVDVIQIIKKRRKTRTVKEHGEDKLIKEQIDQQQGKADDKNEE